MVDIHTMDNLGDDITPNSNLCPRINDIKNEAMQSPQFQAWVAQTVDPLLDKLQTLLKFDTKLTLDDLYGLHDCIFVHVCHAMELPPGLTTSLVNEV